MRSEQINELAKALCQAQGEYRPAKKDANNPFFKSSYATLSSVFEVIKEPFLKYKLTVTQPTFIKKPDTVNDVNVVVLETTIMHESGQWISSHYPVISKDNSPQAMGSAMSYAKRYSLAAIAGVYTDEDDDGNAAQGLGVSRPEPTISAAQQQFKQSLGSARAQGISDAQLNRLYMIATKSGYTTIEAEQMAKQKYNLTNIKDMYKDQYAEFCDKVLATPKPRGSIVEEDVKFEGEFGPL